MVLKSIIILLSNPLSYPCEKLTIDDIVYDLQETIAEFIKVKKDQEILIQKDYTVVWKKTANEDFIMAYFEGRIWFHDDHTKELIAQDKLIEENFRKHSNPKDIKTS